MIWLCKRLLRRVRQSLTVGCMFIAGLTLPLATGVAVEATESSAEAASCAQNLPGLDDVRGVRVVEWDRVGTKHVASVRIHSRHSAGTREVLVRFTEPRDLRGSAFLMVETHTDRELYLWSKELKRSRRIRGAEKSVALFGRAFSYEDFELLLASYRPGESSRVEEAVFGNRPVALVETKPSDAENSAYETIMTMYDLRTCFPLRLELYEHGERLRKVISADPIQLRGDGLPRRNQMVVLRDLRDFTTTLLMLEFGEQDPFPKGGPSIDQVRESSASPN